MRKLALLAPALLAACSTAPAAGSASTCQPAGLERFAGQPASGEVGAEILRVSKAAVLRWVAHGSMITMEFRADRVTVYLTADNKIERVSCG